MNSPSSADDFATQSSPLSPDKGNSGLPKLWHVTHLPDHLKPGDKIIFSFLPTCQENVQSCINQNAVLQRNFV